MSHCSNGIAAIVIVIFLGYGVARAYEDDDLLCRPGWSPELLHQQMWQEYDQQRTKYAEQQYAIIYGAAAEQRNREILKSARRARIEKEARRREELIAKRKAENVAKNAAKAGPIKAADKISNPGQ